MAADLLERRREAVALAERGDEVVGGALSRGQQGTLLPGGRCVNEEGPVAAAWRPVGGRPGTRPTGGTLGAPDGT